jgi:DNA-binding transcriptional ArsR family regulator
MAAKGNAIRKAALDPASPEPRDASASQKAVQLDQLIHERVRLGIISALATEKSLTFSELKAALELTDGNLSIHARKLEDGGYIECHKQFEGRKPQTEYKLTAAGKKALEKYLNHMEALIGAMKPRG